MFARTGKTLIGSVVAATLAAAVGSWFDQEVAIALLITMGVIGICHRGLIAALWMRFMNKRHFSQDQLDLTDFSLKPRGVVQRSAIALYWVWTRIKQISPTEAPALLGIFAVALVLLLILKTEILKVKEDYFQNSIVPEIFGFLLDGLLILGVLGYGAKRKAAKENEALRQVLRAFLWRYAVHATVTLKLSDDPAALVGSEYASYRILNRFQFAWNTARLSLRYEFAASVAKLVEVDADAALSLLPVAATLGSDHTEIWLRVVAILRRLKDRDSRVFVHAFIDLLGAIIELDDLNLLGEKPKLNLQQLVNLR